MINTEVITFAEFSMKNDLTMNDFMPKLYNFSHLTLHSYFRMSNFHS